MNLKAWLAFLCLSIATGCNGGQNSPTAKPDQEELPNITNHEDFRGLVEAAPNSLTKFAQLSDGKRQSLFKELEAGNTTTLQKDFGAEGVLFFKATCFIEGHRGKMYPRANRLNSLYQEWTNSRGDFVAFYRFWNQPVVEGFDMRWVKDLPTRREKGRVLEGILVRNAGTILWPASLQLEPAMVAPKDGVKKLPKLVSIPVTAPGDTIEVWIDVTDVGAKPGATIYFVSSFVDDRGARRYIKPQPKIALGEAPNTLFVTFK